MNVAYLLEFTRGRPSLQFRGELFHARPLSIALLLWLLLAATRLSAGPFPPIVALICLGAPLALLRLCLGTCSQDKPIAQPRLALSLARVVVLMAAMVSVHAFWQWLSFS